MLDTKDFINIVTNYIDWSGWLCSKHSEKAIGIIKHGKNRIFIQGLVTEITSKHGLIYQITLLKIALDLLIEVDLGRLYDSDLILVEKIRKEENGEIEIDSVLEGRDVISYLYSTGFDFKNSRWRN